MKQFVFVIINVILFISCNRESGQTKSDMPLTNSALEGTWKLIYADIREQDSVQIKDLDNTDFIKIINSSHFAFFNQERGTAENFIAGAGTYEFNGTDYTESLDFINSPDLRGHTFPFKVEIKNDTLIQQGHEVVESAGIDRYILEKYVRINSNN